MISLPMGDQNKFGQLYLVISERYLEGELMNSHAMRRELIRAKFNKEYISVVEVSEDFKKEMIEALNELDELE
jgi:hypothetical protein